MKEIVEIVFDVSMVACVAGIMVTLGLGLNVSQIIAPFKNTRMVILALIANFAIVPLFAFGIVAVLPVSEGVRIGIILLSLGGGAPFIPMIVETAKGHVGGAIGLMLLLLITTILFMPIAVPWIFSDASVSAWNIAKSLIFTMVVPLALALWLNTRLPDMAARLQPYVAKMTNASLLVLLVAVVMLYTKTVISHASALPVILLFFLGATAIGYFTGGKSRNARIILSVGTGLRNPPVAMLVARYNFPTEPMAGICALLVMIIGLSILLPLALKIGRDG
jgi:BASS family bile acid:Na+ symporter